MGNEGRREEIELLIAKREAAEDQAKMEEEGDKRKGAVDLRWDEVFHQVDAEDLLDKVKEAVLTAADLIGPEMARVMRTEDGTEEIEGRRKDKGGREKEGEGKHDKVEKPM